MGLLEDASRIRDDALAAIESAENLSQLKSIRIHLLGRKGKITRLLRSIADLLPDDKKQAGKVLNQIRDEISVALSRKIANLECIQIDQKLESEKIDVTLPGRKPKIGRIHPTIRMLHKIVEIFIGLGFSIVEGPEIETEYNNFDALNFPPWHPSRDEHDSFYVGAGYLLRTHTSPAQVRVMVTQQPPVRVIVPGRCFRRDEPDASHLISFFQIEGLYVDRDVSLGDLKGTLTVFARELFGEKTKVRFRPHYFPFTEPSAELDISCLICKGKGCRLCKNTGWLEVLGCGMVHPNVFRNVGYDPRRVNGFAFGLGVERIAMLRYGISDIRLLYENDLGFLERI
ncbi:MAG: phenylalanine--tRNA ligase subunit alpha [bacterium]